MRRTYTPANPIAWKIGRTNARVKITINNIKALMKDSNSDHLKRALAEIEAYKKLRDNLS